MICWRNTGRSALASAALLFGAWPAGAQSIGTERKTQFETRAEVEAAAREAERQHRTGEAQLLESRLRHGDFQEGDKILLTVRIPGLNDGWPPSNGSDTVVVRTGRIIQVSKIPNIPDVSLDGVLRSELVDALTSQLGRYIRNPQVRAVPLLRIAVLGAVAKPGFYSMPSEAVLGDAIMQAGGVKPESDISRTVVRRDGEVIWSSEALQSAFSDGLSLDRLQLRAGDEIIVGEKRQWSITNALQLIAAGVGIYVATRAVRR